MTDTLTRQGLRHQLIRLRNARVAELRDDRQPTFLRMSPETQSELAMDSDPLEAWTLDFEASEFMGIPIFADESLPLGQVSVDWPA